jgi:Na+-transporting methylmalonyl-CoA/oxaloacetate decarboxylase gamma subunit
MELKSAMAHVIQKKKKKKKSRKKKVKKKKRRRRKEKEKVSHVIESIFYQCWILPFR